MVKKRKFDEFDEFSCFVYLRTQNKRKKIGPSVDLSGCLSICMSVFLCVRM